MISLLRCKLTYVLVSDPGIDSADLGSGFASYAGMFCTSGSCPLARPGAGCTGSGKSRTICARVWAWALLCSMCTPCGMTVQGLLLTNNKLALCYSNRVFVTLVVSMVQQAGRNADGIHVVHLVLPVVCS